MQVLAWYALQTRGLIEDLNLDHIKLINFLRQVTASAFASGSFLLVCLRLLLSLLHSPPCEGRSAQPFCAAGLWVGEVVGGDLERSRPWVRRERADGLRKGGSQPSRACRSKGEGCGREAKDVGACGILCLLQHAATCCNMLQHAASCACQLGNSTEGLCSYVWAYVGLV